MREKKSPTTAQVAERRRMTQPYPKTPLLLCFTDRRSLREIGGVAAYFEQVAASLRMRSAVAR